MVMVLLTQNPKFAVIAKQENKTHGQVIQIRS